MNPPNGETRFFEQPIWVVGLVLLGAVIGGILLVLAAIAGLMASGMPPSRIGPTLLIGSLAASLAWLIARIALGKFRRGCVPAGVPFDWGRGLDAGAFAQVLLASWCLTCFAMRDQLGARFPLFIMAGAPVLGFGMTRWALLARAWLIRESDKKPAMVVPVERGVAR